MAYEVDSRRGTPIGSGIGNIAPYQATCARHLPIMTVNRDNPVPGRFQALDQAATHVSGCTGNHYPHGAVSIRLNPGISDVRTIMTSAVAVVMCVYGRDEAALFERALTSIERQEYQGGPVRIYLCVDGPIHPDISSVLDRHRDRIHRIVRNDVNAGLARSLNKLLDSLEDEAFVFRMDSDDYAHANRITAQLAAMRARPDVDILGCGINEVDRSGRVLKTIHYPESRAEIRKFIARRSPLAHPTVCFRRRAIDRFTHYPEVALDQDWALWFKCLSLGLVLSNVRAVLVDMTVSDEFFLRRGPRRAVAEFRILLRGIRSTEGLTWRYVYPVLRLFFRLMPQGAIKWAYRSRLR